MNVASELNTTPLTKGEIALLGVTLRIAQFYRVTVRALALHVVTGDSWFGEMRDSRDLDGGQVFQRSCELWGLSPH